jgi:hypothetical protein
MTQPPPPAPDTAAEPAPDVPAKTPIHRLLTGDRLCIGCGYSLVHQPILREPAYGLLIVRCPECGTVAPVQEYPLLGRWASRLAAIGAAAWLVVILAVLAGTTLTITGAGFMAWEMGRAAVTDTLESVVMRDAGIDISGGYPSAEFSAWCAAEGMPAIARSLVEASGDAWSIPGAAVNALAISPFALAGGLMLSVLLLHQRPATASILGLAVTMGISGLVLWLNVRGEAAGGITWAYDVAFLSVGWRIVLVGMLLNAAVFAVACFFGRSITRWLIRLAVPPRMRGSLAFLWLADDLPPPPGVRNPRGPRVH